MTAVSVFVDPLHGTIGKKQALNPSVGSVGDSYDNALAETINGLYKTEVIRRKVPGGTSKMSSTRRWNGSTGSITAGCFEPIGNVPPAEKEQAYYRNWKSRPWRPDSN